MSMVITRSQDVGAMWEADAAAEWERLNADEPVEDKLKGASDAMYSAWEKISDALDYLATAAEKVDETPAYDKVVSLLNDLEDLQCDIHEMKENWERGRW